MRNLLRSVLYILFRILTRLTVTGRENIPMTGSCLLTGNHLGIIDGPLIFCLIRRDDATGLVALKHKSNPAIRFIVDTAKGIWIDRTRTDFKALKEARTYLKNGGLVGISPEGTRSDSHALIQAKLGVAFLADKSNALILPTAMTGSESSLKKMFTFKRPRVHVRFGEPYTMPPLDRQDRDACLQRNTDEIMCRIAALLPPAYRGVYADHPRLKELLQGAAEGN
jgi:1-acyl-sn-glycerol-3-phosphate acyltransferase